MNITYIAQELLKNNVKARRSVPGQNLHLALMPATDSDPRMRLSIYCQYLRPTENETKLARTAVKNHLRSKYQKTHPPKITIIEFSHESYHGYHFFWVEEPAPIQCQFALNCG